MTRKNWIKYLAPTILAVFFLTACIHDDFEAPSKWEANIGEVITVEQLRNLFTGKSITFETDISVYATVTMDDKSGNIYRSAFVQDHTGAINLRLVAPGGIYKGDSVRINLKGTTLDSYQRMLQLDNVNVDRNIFKLDVLKEFQPKTLTISQVRTGNFQGQLIKLENVQFTIADTGKPYADKEGLQNLNRMLEDCDGNRIIVRTSGYASFAESNTPSGNGSVVAVVSQFQNDIQLYIRQIGEVQLIHDRCAIPGDDYNLISIAAIRQNYQSGTTIIPANSRIEGIVISDRDNDNHPGQNLYIMDESGTGIALRFSSFHDFKLGTKIRVVFASPMPISTFRGLLQIDNIPNANVYDLGPAAVPNPTTLTMAEAINNMNTYQSTLMHFNNVMISGGSSFSGNLTIGDGTGQMLLYTYPYASFHGTTVPSGNVNITGILSFHDEPQLLIRNLNDITQ
jgi:hypothetical protein